MLGIADMKPIDVPTRETVEFLSANSGADAVVLEVGCGEGDVASMMMNRGFDVIGVDSGLEAILRTQARGIKAVCALWPAFDCDVIGTVAFTRSLHHISQLSDAIRKASELLTNAGVLLVEDFAFDEADDRTIRWFLRTLRSSAKAGLLQLVSGELATDLLEAEDARLAWSRSHDHNLHTIGEMTAAIAEKFVVHSSCTVPYLYRYLVPVLPRTPQAAEFLEGVFDEEALLGRRGDIVLIGRRIVASR